MPTTRDRIWSWFKWGARTLKGAFAWIGLFGTLFALGALFYQPWCMGDGCSIQGWLSALSGSAAAIFALAAVLVSGQTLRESRVVAAKQLRAYIFLDVAEYSEKEDRINIAFKNSGSTPAYSVISRIFGWPSDNKDAPRPDADTFLMSVGTVGPDRTFTGHFGNVTPTIAPYRDDLLKKNLFQILWGHVEYRDIFGRPHFVTYRWHLVPHKDGFHPRLNMLSQISDID